METCGAMVHITAPGVHGIMIPGIHGDIRPGGAIMDTVPGIIHPITGPIQGSDISEITITAIPAISMDIMIPMPTIMSIMEGVHSGVRARPLIPPAIIQDVSLDRSMIHAG